MFFLLFFDFDFFELAEPFGLLSTVSVVVALILGFLDVLVEQVLLETAAAMFLEVAQLRKQVHEARGDFFEGFGDHGVVDVGVAEFVAVDAVVQVVADFLAAVLGDQLQRAVDPCDGSGGEFAGAFGVVDSVLRQQVLTVRQIEADEDVLVLVLGVFTGVLAGQFGEMVQTLLGEVVQDRAERLERDDGDLVDAESAELQFGVEELFEVVLRLDLVFVVVLEEREVEDAVVVGHLPLAVVGHVFVLLEFLVNDVGEVEGLGELAAAEGDVAEDLGGDVVLERVVLRLEDDAGLVLGAREVLGVVGPVGPALEAEPQLADEQHGQQLVAVALGLLDHHGRLAVAVLLLGEQVFLDEVLALVVLALGEQKVGPVLQDALAVAVVLLGVVVLGGGVAVLVEQLDEVVLVVGLALAVVLEVVEAEGGLVQLGADVEDVAVVGDGVGPALLQLVQDGVVLLEHDVHHAEVGLEAGAAEVEVREVLQLVGDALQLEQVRLALLEQRLAHGLVVELDLEPGQVQLQLDEDQLPAQLGLQRVFLDLGQVEALVRELHLDQFLQDDFAERGLRLVILVDEDEEGVAVDGPEERHALLVPDFLGVEDALDVPLDAGGLLLGLLVLDHQDVDAVAQVLVLVRRAHRVALLQQELEFLVRHPDLVHELLGLALQGQQLHVVGEHLRDLVLVKLDRFLVLSQMHHRLHQVVAQILLVADQCFLQI